MDQRYVIEGEVQRGYVAARDVATFLPYLAGELRAGRDVLDVGCGTGAITLDVAARVAPGSVVGIDGDSGQVEEARRAAEERSVANVRFEVGSVTTLPFEGGSFDVAYANAVLQYVPEREQALAEMRRVLRPGGVAAVADDDIGTVALSPEDPSMRRAAELFERIVRRESGDPRYSRHLRRLLLDAGFARAEGIAHAPEVYADAAGSRWFADFVTGLFDAPDTREILVAEGWISAADLDALLTDVRDWSERPDAFIAWLYCGALGWVD